MSIDPALAIQAAIVERLRGRTDARDAVYDAPPRNDEFPRIVYGVSVSQPFRLDCIDGTETQVDLHVWSRSVGQVECKRIAGQVRALLDDHALVIAGHLCDLLAFEEIRFTPGAEPNTARAIVSFRIITQPE